MTQLKTTVINLNWTITPLLPTRLYQCYEDQVNISFHYKIFFPTPLNHFNEIDSTAGTMGKLTQLEQISWRIFIYMNNVEILIHFSKVSSNPQTKKNYAIWIFWGCLYSWQISKIRDCHLFTFFHRFNPHLITEVCNKQYFFLLQFHVINNFLMQQIELPQQETADKVWKQNTKNDWLQFSK